MQNRRHWHKHPPHTLPLAYHCTNPITPLSLSPTTNSLRNDLLRQLRKILPLLDRHPQIRLREHRQRIPRHLPLALLSPAAHKMRHSPQLPARDQLQRQPRLERQAVARDVHLRRAARAVADPEAGLGVRVGGELFQRLGIGGRGGEGRGVQGFVDEHLAREAREGAEVGVRRAPVVVGFFFGRSGGGGGGGRREVVQQSGFRAHAAAHDFLEGSRHVALELRGAVAVAAAGDERRDIDDEAAEGFEFALEAREHGLGGPDVGAGHFDDGGVELAGFGFEGGVVDRVGVVAALEGVEAAVGERFFAAGPADVILCLGVFEFGCGKGG